ncbi:MAG: Rpn family recombination-promoting nuclease/putative transposase [Bacteroidales bacterium]|nr:Rpn family recombination-promoting nuclease/putative transposase [Bacteroidales bacterium]
MCKERYINPFTDFGFKRLFGSDAGKAHLISLLNSILVDEAPIVDIRYQNVEKLGMSASDRSAIFDLYCTTDQDTHIIVEMQNAKQSFFLDRSIFYSSFLVQEGSDRGEWDFHLPKIYTIGFLNFDAKEFAQSNEYKHVVRLCDIDTNTPVSDRLTYIYLELKKFVKESSELEDLSDEWLYAIKNLHRFLDFPAELKDTIFRHFFKLAEVSRMSKEERMRYEESLKEMRDYNNCLNTARQDGELEGIIKVAKSLKDLIAPIDMIAKATGLSIEEILKL